MNQIFYTDGSAKANGNPNSKGGWGAVQVDEYDNIIWQKQGFKAPTTNNEMELTAILEVLKYISSKEESFIKPIIYTDSAYCCNLINTWMYSWERNGWKRSKNQEVKNLDLIKQIFELAHFAEIRKISGHSGILGNEQADALATGKISLSTIKEEWN